LILAFSACGQAIISRNLSGNFRGIGFQVIVYNFFTGRGNKMPAPFFSVRKIIDYQSDRSMGFRLRQKRSKRILDLIDRVYANRRKVEIIDVGGTREYWNIIPIEYLRRRNVRITIVNLTVPPNSFDMQDTVFSEVQGDGCNLKEINNNQFDIAHSNSVIEHVGGLNRMRGFAKEMRRVGVSYYVQTPNYFYPIEPHFLFPFFHWLPVCIRLRLAMKFQLGCFPRASNIDEARGFVDLCQLLKKRTLLELFPDARLYKERLFLLVKSFVLIRDGTY
jgi:hypothetical protein